MTVTRFGPSVLQHRRRSTDRPARPVPASARRHADRLLVLAASRGDAVAWDLLVEQHLPVLWRVARGQQLSTQEAEEVVALVWLRLAEVLDRLEGEGVVDWLCATTRLEAWLVRREEQVRAQACS